MKDIIFGVDQETYKKFSKIAEKKQRTTVDEISDALKKHLEFEEKRDAELKESKKLLCEG